VKTNEELIVSTYYRKSGVVSWFTEHFIARLLKMSLFHKYVIQTILTSLIDPTSDY